MPKAKLGRQWCVEKGNGPVAFSYVMHNGSLQSYWGKGPILHTTPSLKGHAD